MPTHFRRTWYCPESWNWAGCLGNQIDLAPKNKLNWANVNGLLLAVYLGSDGLALWVFVVVLACCIVYKF